MRTYVMGLCLDRHQMPVKEGIYPKWIDKEKLSDFNWLENTADEKIPKDCTKLSVYVTGLTMAMLAVVSVCAKRNISLTAYHLNPRSMRFEKQEVL